MSTVMIVGSNRDAAERCRSLLEQEGHRVITAHDARHASRLMREEDLAALVTGEDLPDEDLRVVLRRAHYRDVPVIVVLGAGTYPNAYVSWLAEGFVRSGESGALKRAVAEAIGTIGRTADLAETIEADEFPLRPWDLDGLD